MFFLGSTRQISNHFSSLFRLLRPQPKMITVVLTVHMHCEAYTQQIKKQILKMKVDGDNSDLGGRGADRFQPSSLLAGEVLHYCCGVVLVLAAPLLLWIKSRGWELSEVLHYCCGVVLVLAAPLLLWIKSRGWELR
ncbi:hypothetical protein ZIOFF_038573 [Zingiber officinale]|uniref:Uncharacterized protein n=1 Tax=Zingiber officinale TaxID=94328 RepID=A0A8J5G5Y9_ZINOF|nr:hypothetical protein ZIOFF_038573 [Zingiber officinale]